MSLMSTTRRTRNCTGVIYFDLRFLYSMLSSLANTMSLLFKRSNSNDTDGGQLQNRKKGHRQQRQLSTFAQLSFLIWLQLIVPIASFSAELPPPPKGFTGVRFSLYPNVIHDDDENKSLKQAIKTAVKGLDGLGLEVLPDDVSSCLLGPEPALFEAMRVAFGRAGQSPTGQLRQVSMSCTFSAGCPGEPDDLSSSEIPLRTISPKNDHDEFCEEAYDLPDRVACQFAIYPLGIENHMDVIYDVICHAKKSPSWKEGKSYFCTMLDGEGKEVFDLLRSSFALAREGSNALSASGGHVVMTVTATANKRQWRGL